MKPDRICPLLLAFVLLFSAVFGASGTRENAALAEEESGEEEVLVYMSAYKSAFRTDKEFQTSFEYLQAEAFNRTHPGKKIIIEGLPEAEALATELMSGEADYMLNFTGATMDASKCAASGLFVDLYEWMDADPDFHREDYYENLFEAAEYDGHLYGIVGNFSFRVVFLNRPIAEALGVHYEPLDAIDYAEVLDLYDAALAQGLMAEDTPLVFDDTSRKIDAFIGTEFCST